MRHVCQITFQVFRSPLGARISPHEWVVSYSSQYSTAGVTKAVAHITDHMFICWCVFLGGGG